MKNLRCVSYAADAQPRRCFTTWCTMDTDSEDSSSDTGTYANNPENMRARRCSSAPKAHPSITCRSPSLPTTVTGTRFTHRTEHATCISTTFTMRIFTNPRHPRCNLGTDRPPSEEPSSAVSIRGSHVFQDGGGWRGCPLFRSKQSYSLKMLSSLFTRPLRLRHGFYNRWNPQKAQNR